MKRLFIATLILSPILLVNFKDKEVVVKKEFRVKQESVELMWYQRDTVIEQYNNKR